MNHPSRTHEAEECSSNESGWTSYIVSSDHEEDRMDLEYEGEEEQEEDCSVGGEEDKYLKKIAEGKEDVDSEDSSMASDASSGPSDSVNLIHKHARKKDVKEHVSTKNQKKEKEEKRKQIKKVGKEDKR